MSLLGLYTLLCEMQPVYLAESPSSVPVPSRFETIPEKVNLSNTLSDEEIRRCQSLMEGMKISFLQGPLILVQLTSSSVVLTYRTPRFFKQRYRRITPSMIERCGLTWKNYPQMKLSDPLTHPSLQMWYWSENTTDHCACVLTIGSSTRGQIEIFMLCQKLVKYWILFRVIAIVSCQITFCKYAK